jgi:RNA polymerase sigma factor (sigma-70 family)
MHEFHISNLNNIGDAHDDDPLSRALREIRKSACAGAASVIARIDVIEDIASWSLLAIARRHGQPDSNGVISHIANPRAYAFRIARNEAQRWLKQENQNVSLDVAPFENGSPDDGERANDAILDGIIEPNIVVRQEYIDALPELFERFREKVLDRLPEGDREFFHLYFIEKLPPDDLAKALGVQPKSLAQRWRRLLLGLHQGLVDELNSWSLGKELFYDILHDHDRIVEFLCLLRLFIQEGFDAVKDLIDSIARH